MVGEKFECGGFKLKGGKVEINRRFAATLFDEFAPADVMGIENCMRCGVCSYTCPFWLVDKKSTNVPAWRTYEINKIYSMFYTGYGIVARFLRLRRIKGNEVMKWVESAYNCTACGACTFTSPMEIPNWYTALIMRRALHLSGFNYESAEKIIGNAKSVGNSLGLTQDEWKDIANKAGLPVDKKDAEVLYVPSPLEIEEQELLTEASEAFSKLKVNFTVSSIISDPGYYPYFLGDFETARKMYLNVLETAKKLGVKRIVTTDGTAFFWLRWQGPKSSRVPLDIEVKHLSEIAYERYKSGTKFKKADIEAPTIPHYSEFLSRLGGVEEPVRQLLRATAPEFKEPKVPPSSHNLYTCPHHLELISEVKDNVKKVRGFIVQQLNKWEGKSVIVFDPNCKKSLENAIADGQANFKEVIYFTRLIAKGVE
jgi:Fe-S oxidoreductase